jgi:exonuclease III
MGLNVFLSPHISLTIIGLYRPPTSDISFYDHLNAMFKEHDQKKEIIFMGDLNIFKSTTFNNFLG